MHTNCGFLISHVDRDDFHVLDQNMHGRNMRSDNLQSCSHNLMKHATLCCNSPAHSAEREGHAVRILEQISPHLLKHSRWAAYADNDRKVRDLSGAIGVTRRVAGQAELGCNARRESFSN